MDKSNIAHIEHSFQERQTSKSHNLLRIRIILTNGEHKLFTDHHQVCDYINAIEKRKALESGERIWSFIRRRYKTLHSLYYSTPSLKDLLTLKEKEAVEKELGLVEIVKGNKEHITQFLFRSCLDIEPLKRDWCKEYCKAHGLTHLEFELAENNTLQ
jgi:hypothetical protein